MSRRLGIGALSCIALASCASGALEHGAELGTSGAAFATRLNTGYVAAQGVYDQGDLLDCVNYYMSLPAHSFADPTAEHECPAGSGEPPLFAERIALTDALRRAYDELQTFSADQSSPNLGPALQAAAVSAERLERAIVDDETWRRLGPRWTPERRAELNATAALVGQAVDAFDRSRRLHSAREASRALRGMLEILDAAYDAEASVIDSIRRVDAVRRGEAIAALRDGDLIDEDEMGRRAQTALEGAGLPVVDYSGRSQAWSAPQSRALIDFINRRQAQATLERALIANSTVRSGLQALIAAHREFETNNDVSTTRIDAITQQMDTLFGEGAQ